MGIRQRVYWATLAFLVMTVSALVLTSTPARAALTVCRDLTYATVANPCCQIHYSSAFSNTGSFLAATHDQDTDNSSYNATFGPLVHQTAATVWVGFYADASESGTFKGWDIYVHSC
jgi:hypothetical protein